MLTVVADGIWEVQNGMHGSSYSRSAQDSLEYPHLHSIATHMQSVRP